MRLSRQKERDIRNALRREIMRKQLIDTGMLHESIEVEADIDVSGVLEVTVYAMDYIKYLWEPFKLYEFIYRDKNMLSNAYLQWVNEKIKKQPMLDWRNVKPKVVFNLPE